MSWKISRRESTTLQLGSPALGGVGPASPGKAPQEDVVIPTDNRMKLGDVHLVR